MSNNGILAHKASGRATCGICEKKIEKGTVAIEFWGYQTGKQYHIRCINRMANKIKFENGAKINDGI